MDGTLNPKLQLSTDEMRALGYRVVDMLVDHFEGLADRPVPGIAARKDLETILREPIPEQGSDPAEVLAQLRRDVFGNISHVDHPRFFAFIPSPSNFVSAMADALTSGHNVFAGTWIESAGPSMVELVTLEWLCRLCGLPESAGGLFTSGGSIANLTALTTARHVKLGDRMEGAVAYMSDQTHSSVERSLRILGFQKDQMRKLPTTHDFRLVVPALRNLIREDVDRGLHPFCVIANAGTTNTGAVDPLGEIAAICREEELWLHVDGAYGAAAVLSDRGRALLQGIELADSVALDPHKWMFQPYEMGCVLLRDRRLLKDTFHILPEYLKDMVRLEEEEINFADYGIQLTRSFRALKLWMSLKVFGFGAFREAVEHGMHMAEYAETLLRDMPGWEVTTPASLAIVTFRYAPATVDPFNQDMANRRILDRMNEDGFAMLSSTTLRGRLVIRLCPINPRVTDADIQETFRRLARLAKDLDIESATPQG